MSNLNLHQLREWVWPSPWTFKRTYLVGLAAACTQLLLMYSMLAFCVFCFSLDVYGIRLICYTDSSYSISVGALAGPPDTANSAQCIADNKTALGTPWQG